MAQSNSDVCFTSESGHCRRGQGPLQATLEIVEVGTPEASRVLEQRTSQMNDKFPVLKIRFPVLLSEIPCSINTSVADDDMKTALAALLGIVALGGFAVRQWLKYQHQTLKYHMELTENILFPQCQQ